EMRCKGGWVRGGGGGGVGRGGVRGEGVWCPARRSSNLRTVEIHEERFHEPASNTLVSSDDLGGAHGHGDGPDTAPDRSDFAKLCFEPPSARGYLVQRTGGVLNGQYKQFEPVGCVVAASAAIDTHGEQTVHEGMYC